MLTRSEIIDTLKQVNATAYETQYRLDSELDILFLSGKVEEFIQFLKENSVKSVFYSFKYLVKDNYLISDSDKLIPDEENEFEEIYDRIYEGYEQSFKSTQEKFNACIDSLNFDIPVELHLFCIVNSSYVGIIQHADWEKQIPSKREVLSQLERMYREQCETAKEKATHNDRQAHDKAIEELKRRIDTSTNWYSCTNKILRRDYCASLVRDFYQETGISIGYYEIDYYLELVYSRYRAEKKKK